MIRYGSVCSGIEAATTAWHPFGWQPVFFSEIEPFPCSVLAHHWPRVPNLGDLTQHESWKHEPIDLLVGGTPCQAFSVAGLREGLADPRGNLTLTFLALVKRTRPRWVVWENVPGVLSDATNAFGHFLSGLAELGYGWAYRVLDAQYFGVAQRRRRVFVVACAGADWRRAAAVLFEPDCLRGNPPPSREKGQGFTHDVAPCIGASGRGFERGGDTRRQDPVVADVIHAPACSPALKARDCKGPSSDGDGDGAPLIAHALRGEGFDASEDGTGRGTPLVPVSLPAWVRCECCDEFWCNVHACHTHECDCPEIDQWGDVDPYSSAQPSVIAFQPRIARNGRGYTGDIVNALQAQSGQSGKGDAAPCVAVASPTMRVRRLTPRECERLQGFPDDHTLVPHRGKPAADGPRYKAIGNSMAVPVMAWIGQRIQNLDSSIPHQPSTIPHSPHSP